MRVRMQVLKGLPEHVKVVDLSADFRLRSVKQYEQWYGGEHKAPELQKEAVYGITELHRQDISNVRHQRSRHSHAASLMRDTLIQLVQQTMQ